MNTMRQMLYSAVILSLLLSSFPVTRLSAAPIRLGDSAGRLPDYSTIEPLARNYLTPPDSQPLLLAVPTNPPTLYGIEAELQAPDGPYRATVTIRGTADLARLKNVGATILSSTKTSAVVIVDRSQLEQIAKLGFLPRATELTDRLQTTGGRLPRTATSAQILAATAVDSDNDGLNDTEEGWWCTDPNNADSNNDKVSDGANVQALRDWLAHKRATRPPYGPPFSGWPPEHVGCYDRDYDSVPDSVEVYVFGLNPLRESTARDKFDDGQKLFGLTNCPGSGGGCGYGALPRQVDWGVIFAEMPTWVKPPYDSPFVAAFPVPEVSVIPGSWKVERVTTITTQQGQMTQTTNTYETAVTRGQSTSIADTVTWNNWEEVSQAVSTPIEGSITRTAAMPRVNWGRTFKGAAAFTVGTLASGVALTACGTAVLCPLGVVGLVGGSAVASMGWDELKTGLSEETNKNPIQQSNLTNIYNNSTSQAYANASASASAQASVVVNNNVDFQGVVNSLDGVQYAINQQGALMARGLHDISYAISQPRLTETHSNGRSWGGAQTTTHTVMEEHTISQGQAFASGENWSTAWAVDSSYAANLTFNYTIKNSGSEYAREITGLIFNIYLGDDPNPIISYPAWQQFPDGKLENVFPGDVKTFASTPAVHLTLEQMKRIDLGEKLVVTLADFSYGVDQLFYQDAINSGVTMYIDDGVDDDDELVDQYVLPTWGEESVQDVIARYFPIGMDDDGLMNAMWTPEFGSTPQWNEHFLSEIAWWNVYLTQADAGNTQLRDLTAQASSALLFRFNRDSDRDGYPDRIELQYGTNKNDPASHPNPEVLAGYTIARQGNTVTVKLALQNNGTFDAFGVQSVMYSPDGTTTINDNTIGGNGRVRPGSHVAVGSLIKRPVTTNWTSSTAKPYSTGDYTGSQDKTYTFTVATPGVVGSGTTAMNWSDGSASGSLALGSTYHAPLPIAVGSEGLQVGFDTGTIISGESFTVAAYTPRDTFKFTVNNDPYTMPVIVVSYSDMQGSHRFITTADLTTTPKRLGENLTSYSAQMLRNLGVDTVTQAKFASSGNNTTHLVVNNPHSQTIQNANLYVDIVGGGAVVAHLPYTLTLQSGPTIVPVTWSTASFSPAYNASIDYLILASWTDSEGNVIDTRARPLSTFDVDPSPVLNTSPASWNFGTVAPGAQPQQVISVVNTGIMPLNVVVSSSDPKLALSGANGILSVPPAGTLPITASLDTTALSGAVSMAITIRSNDPAHQTVTVPVNGTVTTASASATAFEIANRPLDKTIRVYGNVAQFSTVDFTHGIQPDTATIEPCKIYGPDGTLKGVGKHCADFAGAVSTIQMLGDGADGALVISTSQAHNTIRTGLSTTSPAGQPIINVSTTSGLAVGKEILIHQTQGTSAGTYEFGTIASLGTGTITLQRNLQATYTQSGSSRAQVILVPHYTTVTIQSGGILTVPAWDGTTGGILALRANGLVTINGTIDTSGKGFRGANGVPQQSIGKRGEGTVGSGGDQSVSPNGNGGGGGYGQPGAFQSVSLGGGGGGGHSSSGNNGGAWQSGPGGSGGNPVGTQDLTTMVFGGGGGTGGTGDNSSSDNPNQPGGNGAGIIYIAGQRITVSGGITSIGGNGTSGNTGSRTGAGGGAGGSILLKGQSVSLGSNLVTATGGTGGGAPGWASTGVGGNGASGRIRVEYCDTLSGSTFPSASTQKLTCYIAENISNVSFGTGIDGPLTVTTNQTINTVRTALSATSNAGQPTLNVASTSGFAANQEVLIHQTQGTGAGNYEFGKIASIGSGTLTLQQNLQNTYTQGGNSLAQVIRVPHYTDLTVQSGGTLTAPAWDGTTGGILVYRANGTTTINGVMSAAGRGFPGGPAVSQGIGRQGKSYVDSVSNVSNAPNAGGGGGGLTAANGGGGGGGAAHASSGMNGGTVASAGGGNGSSNTYGELSLTKMFFGSGGGSSGGDQDSPSQFAGVPGGNGGGIVVVFSKSIVVNPGSSILAKGDDGAGSSGGGQDRPGGGGGGSGGSILLRSQTINLGSNLVMASGGAGGIATGLPSGNGGAGGNGRIRVEYCDTLSGSTSPAASAQKLNCYIADKPDASTIHFTVPDNVTNGINYIIQFGRRLAFTGPGNQLTDTRVVSQTYASATMDVLITNVGAGGATNLQIQVGNQTVYSQASNITQPTTINIPNFASAVNQYIVSQPPGSSVDVPMRVTIDRQADVMLTNMGLTPGVGLDLAVSASDLVVGCPGGAACLATEGNTIPISVTVHNTGAQNASSAVVGYYVGDPLNGNGGRLLGNSYVATIPAGGTATANFNWNTEGFTHTQTLYAFVDPPNAIAETLENNNIVSQTLNIKTKPELRVASIALDRTDRVVGESILATVVIANTGETDAVAHNTRVSIQGERGDGSSGDVATASVAATNAVTITAAFIPGKFGTHTITVTADSANAVAESNEANNVLTRMVYVGLPAQSIDVGSATDTGYNATSGSGFLNGTTYDFGTPTGAITKTVRFDGNGNVQYRFDGLQPSRFYHLDATFYQEGDNYTQKLLFDGVDSGQTIPMVHATASATSILVPSSAYTDTTMVVSFQRPSGGPLTPTRFSNAHSAAGPAFVSQVSLTPIEYTYLDSGGASDVAYDANRGYGYLATNGAYASTLGGNDAVSTYRSAFGDTLYYQFDRLDPAKNYLLDLTMYDGASSSRIQSVTLDNNPVASCTNLAANSTQKVQCPIDPARYTSDRIIIVGIVCVGCTGPRVNEIALEEKTRDVLSPALPPASPTPTPSAAQTTVSSFAAQWSGNLVQVTWATTAESKLSKFELYRTTTLDPAAWTLVRSQTSQSNCATSSTPYSYAYADNAVVNTQTYYYKLTWSGDTCGGTGGAHTAMAMASPVAAASLAQAAGWNLVSFPVSPTVGYNANSVATAINTQGGNCTEVDRWRDGWDSHILGLPFNNFALDLNSGFFLKCSRPSSWSLQGLPVSQPRALNLFAGWNLISIPYAPIALSAETMTDQMNAQGGNCPEVDRWLDGWDSHLNGLPFNDFAIERGVGYFVKCTKASTYIPNSVGQPLTPARASISKPVVNPARRPAVSSIKITNVRDTMFTVSWVTSIASQGWVNYGPTASLGTTAYDDRAPGTVSTTHHVTVRLLNPSTLYYFDVVSDGTVDNNGGSHYTVTTGTTIGLPSSDAVYGRVFQSGAVTPAAGVLVYATLNDNNGQGSPGASQPLSAITDGDGYWSLNLGNTRVSALTSYYLYSASGDRLSVTVDGGPMGTGSQVVDTSADAPAASLTLSVPLQNYLYYLPFIGRTQP